MYPLHHKNEKEIQIHFLVLFAVRERVELHLGVWFREQVFEYSDLEDGLAFTAVLHWGMRIEYLPSSTVGATIRAPQSDSEGLIA